MNEPAVIPRNLWFREPKQPLKLVQKLNPILDEYQVDSRGFLVPGKRKDSR